MRLRFNQSTLSRDRGRTPGRQYRTHLQDWYRIEMDLDCSKQSYALSINGEEYEKEIPFQESTPSFERIVFRTGPYRGLVPSALVNDAGERPAGLDSEDLPGADEKITPSVYWIDDLKTDSL